MRASNWLYATLKETPHDAEIISHQLMLRAGMIRKLGAGLYTWLPLGLKVLQKVEQIVREEMNRSGAMEVLMPAIQPAELWQETGRWDTFGGQLLTMNDSGGRSYCFGPTHEEVITDLMRNQLKSYKQLPVNFYQIQTKFRDEIRPRFGVMRAREFLMKDAYSFHLGKDSLEQTYQVMYKTYSSIFDRLGLKYRAVEADTGAIGGSDSHEFQVLADSGEDVIYYSDTSNYAANIEQATDLRPDPATKPPMESIEKIKTPNKTTINSVAEFLNVSQEQTVKTLVVEGADCPLVALILKGSDDLNEIKTEKHPLVKAPLTFAKEEDILQTIGAPLGSIGPVDLSIPIIVDHHALALESFICGANEKDYHLKNVSWVRDVGKIEAFDLRSVMIGDKSPDGQGLLTSCRGIEVGHIFQLGNKYAKAMGAEVQNEEGKLETMEMGCYGLGISRVIAASIEQNHDEYGIIWPEQIAPFRLVIIPINGHRSELVKDKSESIYQKALKLGIDVIIDDRKERPGVLFADNDLIGVPYRLVVSDKNLNEEKIEFKARTEPQSTYLSFNEVDTFLQSLTSF